MDNVIISSIPAEIPSLSEAAQEWAAEVPTVAHVAPPTQELIASVAPARCPQCAEDLLVLDAGKCCLNEWCDMVWA